MFSPLDKWEPVETNPLPLLSQTILVSGTFMDVPPAILIFTPWMPPSKFREASMMEDQLFDFDPVSRKLGTYQSRGIFIVILL